MPGSNYSVEDEKQVIIAFLCYKGAIISKSGQVLHCFFECTQTYSDLTQSYFLSAQLDVVWVNG